MLVDETENKWRVMKLPEFEVKGFQTIEEYINALEIRRQVERRLKTEERNRQLWGGKCCGRLRRRRRSRDGGA